jgi:hypothetical protein
MGIKQFTVGIDDIRDVGDITARTYEAGLALLQNFKGQIDVLYMDHDLGSADERDNGDRLLITASIMDVLPPCIRFVTSNPVGRENMVSTLRRAGFQQKITSGKIEWVREEVNVGISKWGEDYVSSITITHKEGKEMSTLAIDAINEARSHEHSFDEQCVLAGMSGATVNRHFSILDQEEDLDFDEENDPIDGYVYW